MLAQIATQTPEQPVSVIVQKADKSSQAEALVQQLGGKITKDLRIINAFAAETAGGRGRNVGCQPDRALGLSRCTGSYQRWTDQHRQFAECLYQGGRRRPALE